MILQNLQVNYEELPHLEEIIFTPHPKKYLKLRLLKKGLFMILLLIGVIVMLTSGEIFFTYILAAAWLIVVVLILIAEFKGFKIRGYALRERDISYKSGWIFFSLTSLPFNRIQHSEISQGPLERLFKLSTLRIYTAGGAGSDLQIEGLSPEEAEKLKEYIAKVTDADE